MNRTISAGIFYVDAIFLPSEYSPTTARYPFVQEIDLGIDEESSARAHSLAEVAIENGYVRLLDPSDQLPGYKATAKNIVANMKIQWIKDGAPTSVVDAEGKIITMDCDYSDKDNLGGLLMIMGLQGMTSASVRDHFNVTHVLTVPQIQQMIQDMVIYVAGTFYRKWKMYEDIEAAKSLSEIEAIIGQHLL